MINCSLHNYKEWMETYINGQLSKADMLSAESFLQQHPHLLDFYLEELEAFSLAPEEIGLVGKENLQISIVSTSNIHSNNFSEYFIRYVEGLLNKSEKTELQSFIESNPKLKTEMDFYSKTKLVADTSVQYPSKKELLKRSRPAVPLLWPISAAASILLIITAWFLWPSPASTGLALSTPVDIQIKNIAFYNPQTVNDNQDIQFKNDHKDNQNNFVEVNNIELVNKKQAIIALIQPKREKEQLIISNELQISTIEPYTSFEVAYIKVPQVGEDIFATSDDLAYARPQNKGLLNKIFNDEPKYIEDYVNATFSAFKNNKEDDKWVLKVDRDQEGKSKRIKFTSPIFSTKSKN